ncbi:tRNA uracil 4-sulfurtransferase ThiI [Alkalibacterium sp. MB6]|uniref:tRNA uracil 4-sulfurtransferase ThiI n=1 Tax=Alkalibacterium sp. MB6 TaxID=2081965 RepID=UPI00137B732D|nr:tRNA uracil 4-sulfurtransferase ThiI [Alkalibacterium sp. MB6]
MQVTEIMIRYGELSTKGKNKKYFIKKLLKSVREKLAPFPNLKVDANRDRLYILLNGEEADAVIESLTDVFGIQSISPVIKVDKSIDRAKEAVISLMGRHIEKGMTFKINTRRADHEFEYDTNEVNRILGSAVEEAFEGISVKMKEPSLTARVEIRQDGIYLSVQTIQGRGGLPVRTAGKGMLMLSGGIDSPVAGYLSLKRGMEIEAVHFHSPPYTSPQALQKAKDLAAKLARFTGPIQFIEVPFTEIQETIKREVPDEYSMTVTRRMMLRLTDEIRVLRKGLAIVNGESLGQVASQTMDSMFAINEVTTTPVLRPLISVDKNDIIAIAKDIDTFNLAVQPFEDCCTIFAPAKPKTRPKLAKVKEFEAAIDVDGLIERAMARLNVERITETDNTLDQQSDLFETFL